jgi:hypothetical protein
MSDINPSYIMEHLALKGLPHSVFDAEMVVDGE